MTPVMKIASIEAVLVQQALSPMRTDDALALEKCRPTTLQTRISSLNPESAISWGRCHRGSFWTSLGCAGIMLLCPLLVIFTWIALEDFGGSFTAAASRLSSLGLREFAMQFGPQPSLKGFAYYISWLLFQALLFAYTPSKLSIGQLTPAGHLLEYHTNGLGAWAITHVVAVDLVLFGVIDPAIIAKNWECLLIACNVYGFLLTAFAYAKALASPTHAGDRKFSGEMPTGIIPSEIETDGARLNVV
jgi:7-dehydrocholesterol reductase